MVESLQAQGRMVLWEATCIEEAKMGEELGVSGLVAKGHESGGRVGEETTFILLQRFLRASALPVWAQGGVGLHTAAACYVAGAAGAVLDCQLWLSRESPLPEAVQTAIRQMDGSETACLGGELRQGYRLFARPGLPRVEELRTAMTSLASSVHPPAEKILAWRRAVSERVGWSERHVWLLGQDAAFSPGLAHRFRTTQAILEGFRAAIAAHVKTAQAVKPLDQGTPLAVSHRTRYPIVQGPMTRVSDTPAFARRVADGGALPFLALALMRAPEADTLLKNTRQLLGEKSWGVGILGFVPSELRQEQLEMVRRYRPPFALIAGGRPDQALELEQEGIATYLHVPSPGLLDMFVDSGARRFVFEGRECGGHVGPRSSFVLWNSMMDVLLRRLPDRELAKCHVLFAGGIHDAMSASMVAAMAAPLVERGVKVGTLLGTAYLFTQEAVEAEAILPGFQREATQCTRTVLVETGPGHAIRCVPTPYVDFFECQKQQLVASGLPSEQIRLALEQLNIGRLRIASKGLARNEEDRGTVAAQPLVRFSEQEQRQDGMYMIGQLAALRDGICTIAQLHADVCVTGTERLLGVSPLRETVLGEQRQSPPSDIAIIGMACVLPKAPGLETFWENIWDKVDAISEIPAERWDWRRYYDPDPKARDKVYSKWGGFVDEIPFDPMRYGIPPNTIPSIEPLQLLTLAVAHAALTDAGYSDRPYPHERASVILGAGGGGADLAQKYSVRAALPTYLEDQAAKDVHGLPEWTEDSFPGILVNVAAGRVANRFDLGGVNYTVDAACASSLAAIYQGVIELETGSSDLVIAGGTDTMQNPMAYLCFSKTPALSPRGRCRAFDDTADGTVIGEGVAIVILKRLADAERDGDRIYAVIKAIAGSSDGRDKSLTAPRPEGQIRALTRAYAKAQISPATVELIEAHGTGTVAGDQAEMQALKHIFEASGSSQQVCAVGSVKSLIGHTKCTAGVAGLVKAALALHHKVLPPTAGVQKPNEKVRFSESPFYVNSEVRPWVRKNDQPRKAAVSAFGFGGTNFHAVLEEYAPEAENRGGQAPRDRWPAELLVWSAATRPELVAALTKLEQALSGGAKPELRDLAWSLWRVESKRIVPHRGQPRLRLAIVATSLADLQEKLASAREQLREFHSQTVRNPRGIYFLEQSTGTEPAVAFLFPGQGSQYTGMLGDLALHFNEVRERFETANRVLQAELASPLSTYVFPPPSFDPQQQQRRQKELTQTQIAQPALGAASMGMFRLLESLGVRPGSVGGHSYGEYVALCSAKAFDEETLFRISETRGRVIAHSAQSELGTMAAADADGRSVSETLEGMAEVWIANLNSPRQTTISGTSLGLERAMEKLEAAGVRCHPLPVACAFHSPLIAGARDRLAQELSEVKFSLPEIEVFSNSSAQPYPHDCRTYASHLAEHLVRPVDFVGMIEAMYAAGTRIFVELGPRNVLSGLTAQILHDRAHLTIPTDAPGRPGLVQLEHALGQLYAEGVPVELDRLFQGRSVRHHDIDNLVEATRERALPVGVWMINGGHARPASGSARSQQPDSFPPQAPERDGVVASTQPRPNGRHAKEPSPSAPLVDSNKGGETSTSVAARSASSKPVASEPQRYFRPREANGDGDAVLFEFNRLMNQFLVTEKEIMLSYLQRGNGHHAMPGLSTGFDTQSEGIGKHLAIAEEPFPSLSHQVPADESLPTSPEPAAQAPPAAEACVPTVERLTSELLRIVSERTGYPKQMLDLDSDIEADLGIDSIKRVEILTAFLRCFASADRAGSPGIEELTKAKTLRSIIDQARQLLDSVKENRNEDPPAHPVPDRPAASPSSRPESDQISRFSFVLTEAPPKPGPGRELPGSVVVVTDDEKGVARVFVDRLQSMGLPAALIKSGEQTGKTRDGYTADWTRPESAAQAIELIRQTQGKIGGLVHLNPFHSQLDLAEMELSAWRKKFHEDVKGLFYLAQAAAPDLIAQPNSLCGSVISIDAMQSQTMSSAFPSQGALRGLLKTLALEWPSVRCKVAAFETSQPAASIADQLLQEIAGGDPEVEVGFHGGRRFVLRPAPTPYRAEDARQASELDANSVVLITGGARGITAEVACRMAEYKPTLLLVGRAEFPEGEEPRETAECSSPTELKARLLEQMRRRSASITPAAVEAAYRRLLRERDMRERVSAMRRTGARVQYFQADVRDECSMRNIFDDIYRTYGRLDGVVHGAGVIEDKLLTEKTSDSFDRVFDTKMDGAFLLSRLVRSDSLKFMVFFSSISGCFGNRGQIDYAAANAGLDHFAAYLNQRWPGRVLSLDWGPWDQVGMVSDRVRQLFLRTGVELISPDAGARALEREMIYGSKEDSQILLGQGPWGSFVPRPSSVPHMDAASAETIVVSLHGSEPQGIARVTANGV
ncbi:MAG TPA: SDR family NAD(P)-dependent oxidoreductase [Candidatus Acidoferrales bacterium]|nr:SDR family NAD(P)-dependent oxidoreductase [Candidatus Acidoferrales bacterium]